MSTTKKSGNDDAGLPTFSKSVKRRLALQGGLGPGTKVTDGHGNVLHDSTNFESPPCVTSHHALCKVEYCMCKCHLRAHNGESH